MRKHYHKRCLKLQEINDHALRNPEQWIQEETDRYAGEIQTLARHLAVEFDNHGLVMLSGPSSSGKTTSANMLGSALKDIGVEAYTISMDDFYRGRELAPRLPNGNFDYEALEALRLDELERCMRELLHDGRTMLPRFDFQHGRPADEMTELVTVPNSVVIFEGIHAINPYFEERLPSENIFKIFVNTVTPVYDGETKLLARRDIRLTRRMLRDERFRNSPVTNTLNMWQQVVRGENEYMFPYVDTVDYLIDTTHAYEPCIFGPLLLKSLDQVPDDHPLIETVRHMQHALSEFQPLPLELMPKHALLREFVGE